MADDLAPTETAITVDEFERLCASGALAGRTVELRRGEIVDVNAVRRPHARIRKLVARALEYALQGLGSNLTVFEEVSIRFAAFYPIPDIVVFADDGGGGAAPAASVRLVVEVSDDTFRDDIGPKRDEYESAGLAEYWVADVNRAVVHRFVWEHGVFVAAPVLAFGAPWPSLTIVGLSVTIPAL
jgi:Uma2 family endonuclease